MSNSFITHKRIAVVGNALSLFDKEYGSLIDSYDVVCRFNRGITVDSQLTHGNRLDLAFISVPSIFMDVVDYVFENKNAIIIMTSLTKRNIPYNFKFIHIPKSLTLSLAAAAGVERPSSGLMAINYILSHEPAECHLFGFDFKATPTYYDQSRTIEPHDYAAEKKYVMKLKEENQIEIFS